MRLLCQPSLCMTLRLYTHYAIRLTRCYNSFALWVRKLTIQIGPQYFPIAAMSSRSSLNFPYSQSGIRSRTGDVFLPVTRMNSPRKSSGGSSKNLPSGLMHQYRQSVPFFRTDSRDGFLIMRSVARFISKVLSSIV